MLVAHIKAIAQQGGHPYKLGRKQEKENEDIHAVHNCGEAALKRAVLPAVNRWLRYCGKL